MGAVSRDIEKSERIYHQLTLSDISVIRWLIEYRDKIDPYYKNIVNNNENEAGNVKELNGELICLYADLDKLIKECEFEENELRIINCLSEGYTYDDIKDFDLVTKGTDLSRRIKRICKKIKNQNDLNWKKYIHYEYLDTFFRKCSSCEKEMPLTKDFYTRDNKEKSGFKHRCKKCFSMNTDKK